MSSMDAPSPVSIPFNVKTVIYATDLSPRSENTGRYAALLARQFDAELLVAHSFVLTQAAMEAEAGAPGAKSNQRQEHEAALAKFARQFGEGVRRTVPLLVEGEPAEELVRLAAEHQPSILVVGTGGGSRFERSIMASAAETMLRTSTGPTLAVGPHVPNGSAEAPKIQRILYATSLSPEAARGAGYAVAMADAFHAQMDVLHVFHDDEVRQAGGTEQLQQQFQAAVESLIPVYPSKAGPPHGVVAVGKARTRILEHIRERSIDLLVLSLHATPRVWLESLVSDAFEIIADAPCPVLTVLA